MVESMEDSGYVGFEACLEISVLGVKMEGGLQALGQQLMELTNAALIFSAPELSGWFVRFPVKRELIDGAS